MTVPRLTTLCRFTLSRAALGVAAAQPHPALPDPDPDVLDLRPALAMVPLDHILYHDLGVHRSEPLRPVGTEVVEQVVQVPAGELHVGHLVPCHCPVLCVCGLVLVPSHPLERGAPGGARPSSLGRAERDDRLVVGVLLDPAPIPRDVLLGLERPGARGVGGLNLRRDGRRVLPPDDPRERDLTDALGRGVLIDLIGRDGGALGADGLGGHWTLHY